MRARSAIRVLLLVPAGVLVAAACTRPATTTLQFQNNASLWTESDTSNDVESSSAIVPAGACGANLDTYFVGYGQYGGRFGSGNLACPARTSPAPCRSYRRS
jgi:hypothetical protein